MRSSNLNDLKIALVYDRVNKFGGAERVIQQLHQLFPKAPLYTLVYDPAKATWASGMDVRPSFLNLPFLRSHHELLAPLAPLAFETFNFNDYNLVISITSESAKAVITKPNTLHVCYCLTPTRYLWSGRQEYLTHPGLGILSPLVKRYLHKNIKKYQKNDLYLSHRPDHYIAISQEVQSRIRRYYHRPSSVIYPPINYDYFSRAPRLKRTHYLFVSRLVPYKKADLVINAFAHPSLQSSNLIVVGSGSQSSSLKRQATHNVKFLSSVSDQQLRRLYASAKALIFPSHEDFGLVPLEAQACGTPVLAYNQGGAQETVIEGKTGLFFTSQTIKAIINAITKFEKQTTISSVLCRKNAARFSPLVFQHQLSATLKILWQKHQQTYM
ncbi:glycosyltransferase [Candidatus Chazhemtobacterium aquaticus]|uniref:Glycosyltransferase n=1 Tax=Candidatus Chazhemtobacterium aquaticus TaxID=2715735 RepID=A0A857N5X5_9BACT|nr:glycosyltransferase [Candidatus Chazhemtobacterium aquaticus]QHO63527.1 Glycosyltransferase [Candidatus Chazhemtobacterium aquaticus]